jgi:hypothetical protein
MRISLTTAENSISASEKGPLSVHNALLSGVWLRFIEPAGSGILRLQNAVGSGLAVEFACPAASCE